MASISMRSGPPGSPTHLSASSAPSRRRNGLHDVDLNTFIAEEMALHLDNGNRKRSSAQCNDVITDSPTHKRNRLIWALNKNDCEVRKCHSLILASYSDQEMKATSNSAHHSPAHSLIGHKSPVRSSVGRRCSVQRPKCPSIGFCWQTHNIVHYIVVWVDRLCAFKICVKGWTDTIERRNRKKNIFVCMSAIYWATYVQLCVCFNVWEYMSDVWVRVWMVSFVLVCLRVVPASSSSICHCPSSQLPHCGFKSNKFYFLILLTMLFIIFFSLLLILLL